MYTAKKWMPRIAALLLMLVYAATAAASGLFPSGDELFGVTMPDIRFAVGREPERVETGNDGEKVFYDAFTLADYEAFGKYACAAGLKLGEYSVEEGILTAELLKNDSRIVFEYNFPAQCASVLYPASVRKEEEKSNAVLTGSILPADKQTFGLMPSLGSVLHRDSDSENMNADGSTVQEWTNVAETDFEAFSAYLAECGAALQDYSSKDGVFTATIGQYGRSFAFMYDSKNKKAVVTYPKGTYDENRAAATAQPVSEPSAPLTSLTEETAETTEAIAVGSYVTFGRYPQTSEGNDLTPIEWLVLDIQGDKALLISRYGLDVKPYNTVDANVTWETCTLRKWLNNDFLNKAFNSAEQSNILMTSVDNSKNAGVFTDAAGGGNTQDKVFLLSAQEAEKYFGVELHPPVNSENYQNKKARIAPTEYAKNKLAVDSGNNTIDGMRSVSWWLRSTIDQEAMAMDITRSGSYGYYYVNTSDAKVARPVLWTNLNNNPSIVAKRHTESMSNTTDKPFPEIGNYIEFGSYHQTEKGDDITPIEWLILDIQDDKAMLISHYGLDAKPYNTKNQEVTWETCTLRAWLNNDFFYEAFTSEEQSIVLETTVDNSDDEGVADWTANGGNNTSDKVYLLSCLESDSNFPHVHPL